MDSIGLYKPFALWIPLVSIDYLPCGFIGIYNTCLVGSVGLCRLRALVIPVVFIILALWLPLSL